MGSPGDFTACFSYLGYPCFFKEEYIYKVYGSKPSNFQVMSSASLGVEKGSHKSLAIAGEILFYLSRVGVVAYSGGIPQSVLSGGQYDTLLRNLGSRGGAVGFAVYLDSFERFGEKAREYDVDTVLIVKEDDSPRDILKAAEKIRAAGESVSVYTSVPAGLRYRRAVTTEEA